MNFMNRAKVTGIVIVSIGAGWITHQIKKTQEYFDNLLDTSVIDHLGSGSTVKKPEAVAESHSNSLFYRVSSEIFSKDLQPLTERLWHYLKFSYAIRLLHLSQSDIYTIRLKAIKHLSKIKNLEDWQFLILAEECDPSTAVSLARCDNVDPRWFHEKPVRYVDCDKNILQEKTKEFLIMLSRCSQHMCLSYFVSKVFFDGHDSQFSDKSLEPSELVKHIKTHSEVVPLCVESILHHSSITHYAEDILTLKGLPLLHEIYLKYYDNEEMCKLLAQVLYNVSLYPNSLEEFDRSGWIKVLAQWSDKSDLSLSTTAACTLVNLDVNERSPGKYYRQLYLLHPLKRSDIERDVDVVLVHGLLGGVFYTWRQRDQQSVNTLVGNDDKKHVFRENEIIALNLKKPQKITKDFEFVLNDIPLEDNSLNDSADFLTVDCNDNCMENSEYGKERYTKCWPKDWLIKDCKEINMRLLGINFSTTLSMWAPICPEEQYKSNLVERSSELMSKLVEAGVGTRPIIWITHSMGGLLVKQMLIKARESEAKRDRNLIDNTKGIVFFSTPHRGSALAALSTPAALLLWPSAELVELRHNSPLLLEIHDKFVKVLEEFPMKIISFVEAKSTLVKPLRMNLHFVQKSSADLGCGESYLIPLDHLNICKPLNRQSFLYKKIAQLVKEVAKEHSNPRTD